SLFNGAQPHRSSPPVPQPASKSAAHSTALNLRLSAERLVSHPVSALAVLEGKPPGSMHSGPCPEVAPPYVKLAWARATATPEPDTLRDLFASDSAPVRDAACVIAWQRFDDDTNTKLIASLLRD